MEGMTQSVCSHFKMLCAVQTRLLYLLQTTGLNFPHPSGCSWVDAHGWGGWVSCAEGEGGLQGHNFFSFVFFLSFLSVSVFLEEIIALLLAEVVNVSD